MGETGFTDIVMLRISFGLAALVLEVFLFILHMILGYGQKDNNKKFELFIIVVFIGNVVSIADNVFRVSGAFNAPDAVKLGLRIGGLLLNIYLAYYAFLYLTTFISKVRPVGAVWPAVNYVILILSTVFGVVMYIKLLAESLLGGEGVELPGYARIIIGYAVEIYFFVMAIFLAIRYRKHFEKRAYYTAIGAFVVIIVAVVIQFLQTKGILLNYFGAAIAAYIFYIGVEIPDYRNLKKSLEVVQTLASAIDAKDRYTKGHSSRVAAYSREIARRAGFSERKQEEVYMAGLLHDVGKIGVPDAVINKPGALNVDEYSEIKKHPLTGAMILENIKDMPELSVGARWHHERIDGKGYPDGLEGDEIPETSRIIAVADAYDAMTSTRRYRSRLDQEKVFEQLELGKGTQFDSRFADIMIQMMKEDKDFHMKEEENN